MFAMYCRLNVRVTATNREVIAKCRRKIAKRHRTDPAKRADRKAYYRAMLAEHAKAQSLYNYVIKGN